MDDRTRLELIIEAVKYVRHVKSMGMPSSSYTKPLREPIYFLWELRGRKNKDVVAKFRSRATVGVRRGTGDLIYDHAVPFSLLQKELLELADVTPETVEKVLRKHGVAVLITKEEDRLLRKAGLKSRMPAGWELETVLQRDPLARYKTAGIEIIPNVG